MMNRLGFFLRISWNNLRRGGQRTFVALLCISFGVMSLVAMSLVAESFDRTLILEPAEQIGADLSLGRETEEFISPQQAGELVS
jgi:putative ABC transport system permease protein